ncbi:MAG: hypothetical protein ACOYZ8_04940 [Chloroflexota bacterium]
MKSMSLPVLIATLVLALACQSAAQVTETPVPTSTASPTPTRTPTNTPVPTATPTPLPDISAMVLTEADLPKGFKVYKPRTSNPNEGEDDPTVNRFALEYDKSFYQFVIGFTTLLSDEIRITVYSAALEEPETALDLFVGMLGEGTRIVEKTALPGYEYKDVGEDRMQVRMLIQAPRSNSLEKLDGIIFRRGNIGAILLTTYPEDYKPIINIHDLAVLLDQKIIENAP